MVLGRETGGEGGKVNHQKKTWTFVFPKWISLPRAPVPSLLPFPLPTWAAPLTFLWVTLQSPT